MRQSLEDRLSEGLGAEGNAGAANIRVAKASALSFVR